MNVNRTTLFAALLATGIATGAIAQGSGSSGKASPATGSQAPAGASASTPAPPSAGSTGMDKGAGTGATSSTSKASSSLPRSERRFIEKAMQGGMEEVEMSKLAMEKSQNAKVKEFAKRLVDDHTKANAELTKLAGAKGVTPPAAVDASHKRKLESMAKKSGADFDREYMNDMLDDHQKDVREFRSIAKSAKDPDLKAFAASTLPTLEQHLQMAKTTESAVKSANRVRKPTTAGSGSSTMSSGSASGTTAAPGKDAATSGTTASAMQGKGSASDTKSTSPPK